MMTAKRLLPFVLLMLTLPACQGDDALTFSVVFDEGHDLQPGQFVTYKDIRIGEVTAVDLQPSGKVRVKVEVDPEHKDRVYREAKFSVEKPKGMMDLSGERALVMTDRSAGRTPIQNGDIVEGYDGWWDDLAGTIGEAGHAAGEALTGLRDQAGALVTAYEESPEAQAFVDSFSALAGEVDSMARGRSRAWAEEQLPQLREKARAYKKKLEREGAKEKAEAFWEKFQAWTDSVEGAGTQGEGAKGKID